MGGLCAQASMENFVIYLLPRDVQGQNTQTQGTEHSVPFCFLTTLLEQNPPSKSHLPSLKAVGLTATYISNQTQGNPVLLSKTTTIFNTCVSLHSIQGIPKTSRRRRKTACPPHGTETGSRRGRDFPREPPSLRCFAKGKAEPGRFSVIVF